MSKKLVFDFSRFIVKYSNDQCLENQIQMLIFQLLKAEENALEAEYIYLVQIR